MSNLTIRPVHPQDLPDLYEMITDPRVVGTLIFTPTMEYMEEEQWVRQKRAGSHRLVAELDGKVVGSATVRQNLRARTTHAGSVGLLVHADHWGQGIGQRLMTAVLDIADNWLGLMRVELEVFVEERPTNMHRLVAEADGRVAGSISLRQRTNPRTTHVGGIGMMVAPDFWGVGIGSRLMTAVLDIADNWLNLKRVELEVHADNPAAIRLYEKFGFEREGTKLYQNFGDGRWPDTHFMARLRKNESIEESHRGQREHREIQRE